ncbi:MAG: phenylacetate--CoA ligase family protein, partial [Vulcanimicrobiaceae bacterium]
GGGGTPVYTQLERRSQPMIRLVSGDFAEWTDAACPCGRTYPRFPRGIAGRIDDMITVRGENVYPSAIEEVLRGFSEFDGEFEIVVTRERQMEELRVRVESQLAPGAGEAAELIARAGAGLKRKLGVRARIEICAMGSLARTDLKSRRVRDER